MRLFLAAALFPDPAAAVSDVQERLRPEAGPAFRWVDPKGAHLTLRFLGEAEPSRAEALARRLPEALRELAAFEVGTGALGAFPGPERPRVLWLGMDDPVKGLPRLVEAVDAALRKEGLPVEERPFHAHLTLARARQGRRPPDLREAFRKVAPPQLQMRVEGVDLLESTPSPKGSVYRTVARAALGG